MKTAVPDGIVASPLWSARVDIFGNHIFTAERTLECVNLHRHIYMCVNAYEGYGYASVAPKDTIHLLF